MLISKCDKARQEMRVIYMGRKPVAYDGLAYLIQNKVDIVAAVIPDEDIMESLVSDYGISVVTDEYLYENIDKYKDIDLVISFLYWKRIKKPLIDLPKIGCINFHPAPLPEYRGFAPYTFGIYENTIQWGVTCHFVDESFDTGDIVKEVLFDINPLEETAYSLQRKSHMATLGLFRGVIYEVLKRRTLIGTPQKQGRYHAKEDFERIRKIKSGDRLEEIDAKIRACWCPPFPGAYVKINNFEYTLVNEKIIKGLYK
jgi:methionyl-tRNA formyltransferase